MKLWDEEQSAEFEGLVCTLPVAAIGAGAIFAASQEVNCSDLKPR